MGICLFNSVKYIFYSFTCFICRVKIPSNSAKKWHDKTSASFLFCYYTSINTMVFFFKPKKEEEKERCLFPRTKEELLDKREQILHAMKQLVEEWRDQGFYCCDSCSKRKVEELKELGKELERVLKVLKKKEEIKRRNEILESLAAGKEQHDPKDSSMQTAISNGNIIFTKPFNVANLEYY